MRYLSVCSGIEAATVAWHSLGWQAAAYSEIEAFPRAVLAHHYPDVPIHGDFTTIGADEYGPIDLLVGGTPCQSFSIAGLRGGLADDRGNLALEFLRLAQRTRAKWLVWENVPGVLSSEGGRDFGSILAGLGELGYGFAYRVLDAQHFGVPQRRRRVFVVGHLGDWRRAAAVLFERHSLQGDSAPRRQTGQAIAGTLKACSGKSGTPNGAEEADRLVIASTGSISHCLNAGGMGWQDYETETLIAFDTTQLTSPENGSNPKAGDPCHPLAAGAHAPAVAFHESGQGWWNEGDATGTLRAEGENRPSRPSNLAGIGSAVRRLTPRECERLQGFPDERNCVTFRICSNEDERRALARSVPQSSMCPALDQSAPVVVSVQIDLERQVLRLRSLARSELSVSNADERSWSALPIRQGDFVRLAALMTRSLAMATRDGRGVSLQNIRGSSHPLNGSASVLMCGREIERLAASAEVFMTVADLCTKFTMSALGPITPVIEQDLEILCCCVSAAIAGFIPDTIRTASSYTVQIETVGGYTAVPYRGRAAADGPRYKALGNSMAVPVMKWIGERIALVEEKRAHLGNGGGVTEAGASRLHNPVDNV